MRHILRTDIYSVFLIEVDRSWTLISVNGKRRVLVLRPFLKKIKNKKPKTK